MPKIHGLIEGYTLVARPDKRRHNPTHLSLYQQAFKVAAKVCAEETKHLKSSHRVVAMNNCIKRMLKKHE